MKVPPVRLTHSKQTPHPLFLIFLRMTFELKVQQESLTHSKQTPLSLLLISLIMIFKMKVQPISLLHSKQTPSSRLLGFVTEELTGESHSKQSSRSRPLN